MTKNLNIQLSPFQKLEERLKDKGRFREYRRLYQVYPQLGQPIIHYLSEHEPIRRLLTAELQDNSIAVGNDIPVVPTACRFVDF